MENLLDRLSSYNILNYLIPGVLFLVLVDAFDIAPIEEKNILLMLFGGYFAGMVLSRVGSVILEPWFKKWKIVKYVQYKDYLDAEARDSKISTLLSESNMYRTFVAMFLFLLILFGICMIPNVKGWLRTPWAIGVMIFLMLILFVFSYRKQSSSIRKRVEHIIKSQS